MKKKKDRETRQRERALRKYDRVLHKSDYVFVRRGVEFASWTTGFAISTIYRFVSEGKIPHKKINNFLFFDESTLMNWKKERNKKYEKN